MCEITRFQVWILMNLKIRYIYLCLLNAKRGMEGERGMEEAREVGRKVGIEVIQVGMQVGR